MQLTRTELPTSEVIVDLDWNSNEVYTIQDLFAFGQAEYLRGINNAKAAVLADNTMVQDPEDPNDIKFHMWERGQLDACAAIRKLTE